MRKFKVGDRVRVTNDGLDGRFKGELGSVTDECQSAGHVLVRLDGRDGPQPWMEKWLEPADPQADGSRSTQTAEPSICKHGMRRTMCAYLECGAAAQANQGREPSADVAFSAYQALQAENARLRKELEEANQAKGFYDECIGKHLKGRRRTGETFEGCLLRLIGLGEKKASESDGLVAAPEDWAESTRRLREFSEGQAVQVRKLEEEVGSLRERLAAADQCIGILERAKRGRGR